MFHKEGFKIIFISFVLVVLAIIGSDYLLSFPYNRFVQILLLVMLGLILQFFRNPKRNLIHDADEIVAPADGKIVIIQKSYEKEFFKDERLQISIFMSPLNVHVTRYPISGKVIRSIYHKGKYLVAWHPKASELNERTTVVIQNAKFGQVLYRQIAGAVARRIVNYAKEGTEVIQSDDSGFIKFGSRLDVFLPLDTKASVALGQTVKGGIDKIAYRLPPDSI